MEVSDQQGGSGRPLRRRRRVRFTLPRQPRPEGDSVGGVGGHPQVRKNNRTALFNFNRVLGFSTDRVRNHFRTVGILN
jgi:hypothetical protein